MKTLKSTMSAQPIGIINRLVSAWNIFRCHQKGKFMTAELEISYHNRLCDIIKTYVNIEVNKATILELGCGQMARQTALFAADGSNVTGIDMEVPTYRMNLQNILNTYKKNGLERAVKSLVRHVVFDKAYIKKVAALYGKKIPYSNLDTQIMSVTDIKFPDNYFDFIFSLAVFEHVDDVPKAIQEMNRVLKKSGVAQIVIHLFACLSGGHHLEWMDPDKSPSDKVPPWDHLLDSKYPANTYLNGLRLEQFREIFHENTEVVKEEFIEEGHGMLSPQLLELLLAKGYKKYDLLTRIVKFTCRKK